jgi:2'-5' RNA ligase
MFVALDLPEPARSELARWRDSLVAGRAQLRPVPPAALHVTLVFLGWQDEAAAPDIAGSAFAGVAGLEPPRLTALGTRALPPRRPRLFALDLDDPGGRASLVQAAVSSSLEGARFYRPEKRPFWPHVTLARVTRGARAAPLPDVAPPAEAFEATDLTLYRSTLRPQGAVYEPLAHARVGDTYG